MTRELTIKIQLDDNAAYQAKTQALLPVLGLLLECDEKDISYAVEEVKQPEPEPKDIEVTVKGKAQLTVEFEMTFHTTTDSAIDHFQSALDILSDYRQETTLENGKVAEFSIIDFDSVSDCEVVDSKELTL